MSKRELNKNYLTVVEKNEDILLLTINGDFKKAVLFDDDETNELNGIETKHCKTCGK